MKTLTTILNAIPKFLLALAFVLGVVFIFIYALQKQQNEHTEKMLATAVDLKQQTFAVAEVTTETVPTRWQNIKEGAQSVLAFLGGILTKML